MKAGLSLARDWSRAAYAQDTMSQDQESALQRTLRREAARLAALRTQVAELARQEAVATAACILYGERRAILAASGADYVTLDLIVRQRLEALSVFNRVSIAHREAKADLAHATAEHAALLGRAARLPR